MSDDELLESDTAWRLWARGHDGKPMQLVDAGSAENLTGVTTDVGSATVAGCHWRMQSAELSSG